MDVDNEPTQLPTLHALKCMRGLIAPTAKHLHTARRTFLDRLRQSDLQLVKVEFFAVLSTC